MVLLKWYSHISVHDNIGNPNLHAFLCLVDLDEMTKSVM